jgi:hypothetical protein
MLDHSGHVTIYGYSPVFHSFQTERNLGGNRIGASKDDVWEAPALVRRKTSRFRAIQAQRPRTTRNSQARERTDGGSRAIGRFISVVAVGGAEATKCPSRVPGGSPERKKRFRRF